MLGIVVGTIGGFLLARGALRALWWRRAARWQFAHGGGWGRGGFDGTPFARGRRGALWRLFERLDATPGQEKVIRQALEELQTEVRAAAKEWPSMRAEAAKGLRSPLFDPSAMGDLFVRYAKRIDAVRDAGLSVLGRIHEALDERQRQSLADELERGGLDFAFGEAFGGRSRDRAESHPGERWSHRHGWAQVRAGHCGGDRYGYMA